MGAVGGGQGVEPEEEKERMKEILNKGSACFVSEIHRITLMSEVQNTKIGGRGAC